MEDGYVSPQLTIPAGPRKRRLLQNHDSLLCRVQSAASLLAVVGLLAALAWWRDGRVRPQYQELAIIIGLLMVVIYEWRGVFRRFNGRFNGILRIGRAWALVLFLALVLIFLLKKGEEYSRLVLLLWAVLGYVAQVACYLTLYVISRRVHCHYGKPIRALVLGSRWLAEHLVDSISRNSWLPDRIIGVLDDDASGLANWRCGPRPHLGSFDDLPAAVRQHSINRVYIALPSNCSAIIERACRVLDDLPVDVVWVPDIFGMRLLNHSIREINGLPLISLSESPLRSQSHALGKSIMDKGIALLMLIALSPLLVLISILVWRSSPGPILFRQKRHGWDGQVIDVWKFRSMYLHDDGPRQATLNDSRITPIGRFIRRTSIDELPQLFNVLAGTMSLVGPRPHAIEHNDHYSEKIRTYMQRHRIKPGMTGWAQINGYRGETETLEKMLGRVELDLEYINRWSIGFDALILLKTPASLFSRNIY